MAKTTPYQDKIIRRYYQNQDQILVQRLGDLVTDLYLAEGKIALASGSGRPRFWRSSKSRRPSRARLQVATIRRSWPNCSRSCWRRGINSPVGWAERSESHRLLNGGTLCSLGHPTSPLPHPAGHSTPLQATPPISILERLYTHFAAFAAVASGVLILIVRRLTTMSMDKSLRVRAGMTLRGACRPAASGYRS